MKLQNQVALIIGAGSAGEGWGTGKATAVQMAREGAKIVIFDIDEDAAQETATIIEGEDGTAMTVPGNALVPEDVQRAVDATLAAFGRIDILINNLGAGGFGDVVAVSLESWQRDLDLNLNYTVLTCKAVLPIMVQQEYGRVINISSIGAVKTSRFGQYGYCVAKAGLNHLTRLIAVDYARHGIRCNAIMPGILDTPLVRRQTEMIDMAGGTWEQLAATRADASPTGTQGSAWDIASAAVFLASDDANYINGVILPVDGGVTAR